MSKIAIVVRDSARGLDHVKQTRNSIVGLPWKHLEGKARDMANQEEWEASKELEEELLMYKQEAMKQH